MYISSHAHAAPTPLRMFSRSTHDYLLSISAFRPECSLIPNKVTWNNGLMKPESAHTSQVRTSNAQDVLSVNSNFPYSRLYLRSIRFRQLTTAAFFGNSLVLVTKLKRLLVYCSRNLTSLHDYVQVLLYAPIRHWYNSFSILFPILRSSLKP